MIPLGAPPYLRCNLFLHRNIDTSTIRMVRSVTWLRLAEQRSRADPMANGPTQIELASEAACPRLRGRSSAGGGAAHVITYDLAVVALAALLQNQLQARPGLSLARRAFRFIRTAATRCTWPAPALYRVRGP